MVKKILIAAAVVVMLTIIDSEALSTLALSALLAWIDIRLLIRDGRGS